jgi:hypothetical protein
LRKLFNTEDLKRRGEDLEGSDRNEKERSGEGNPKRRKLVIRDYLAGNENEERNGNKRVNVSCSRS